MLSATSNRNDPRFVEYYQSLADVIGVFWQFHKERVRSGNIEFAYMKRPVSMGYRHYPFYPRENEKNYFYDNYRVLDDFGDGVRDSLVASWLQFLKGLRVIDDLPDFVNDTPAAELSVQRFMTPYVHALINKSEDLGKECSKVELSNGFSCEGVLATGINTGARATIQLRALFGEDFRSMLPVILSKVKLRNAEESRKEIGMLKSREGLYEYGLLDNTPYGLNKEKLREFGFGDTLGCPASMQVSEKTKIFLRERGVKVSGTMLEELAKMTSERFDDYVGKWYRELPDHEQVRLVEPETRRVLDGTARREASNASAEGRCPYRPRGERM